ncbi:MAG TPA: toll/interleukin-1 receptor domain-containing protein [Candidatus Acidoferrum sp.]|nr:toll/interleukin-1 receptor domain-containing protein [Candidatus Acidoferrum sp.]
MADTHNVFISWSGERSRVAAEAFREWLKTVLQNARPWMSTEMEKGTRSFEEMARALEGTKVGVVFLTPENLTSEWIHYEVGALSKTVDEKTRVCTYLLVDLESATLKAPLSWFQWTKPNKTDTRKLIGTINMHLDAAPLAESTLNATFEKWWPDLDEKLKALPTPSGAPPVRRGTDDMIAEVLELTRTIVPAIREISEQASRGRSAKFLADAMAEARLISRFALDPLPQREYTTEPPAQPITTGIPSGIGSAFGAVTGEGGAGVSSARSSPSPEAPSPESSSGPTKHRPLPSRSGGSNKK